MYAKCIASILGIAATTSILATTFAQPKLDAAKDKRLHATERLKATKDLRPALRAASISGLVLTGL